MSAHRILASIENNNRRQGGALPDFRAGDSIKVWAKIREGEKTRLQAFEGVRASAASRRARGRRFTVRKISLRRRRRENLPGQLAEHRQDRSDRARSRESVQALLLARPVGQGGAHQGSARAATSTRPRRRRKPRPRPTLRLARPNRPLPPRTRRRKRRTPRKLRTDERRLQMGAGVGDDDNETTEHDARRISTVQPRCHRRGNRRGAARRDRATRSSSATSAARAASSTSSPATATSSCSSRCAAARTPTTATPPR